MISKPVRAALARHLGSEITGSTSLSGGSISDAFAVTLASGRRVFVKENRGADPTMFPAEARGLAWLAEPGAIRLPEVLAVSGDPAFIALELIEPGPRQGNFSELLGRQLAALHRSGPPEFGLDHDNYIGRLEQSNGSAPTWVDFYRDQRLRPQIAMAQSLLSSADRQLFDDLIAKLPALVGDSEPPARLHGDLWAGNLHVTEDGQPCLIDPAAYAGHREVDLAMMLLFGGFDARVLAAYDESHPLAPEWRDRVPLYQLYFLLVHVNLFGASYLGQSRAAARHYL